MNAAIKERSKEFAELIKILYAVVIGQGLIDLAKSLDLPSNYGNFVTPQFAIFCGAMFVTIRDWNTYHASLRKRPHRNAARFFLDILVLLCLFFLIRIASSKPPLTDEQRQLFMLITAAYFGILFLWEGLARKEYAFDEACGPGARTECYWDAVFLLLSLTGLALTYWLSTEYVPIAVLVCLVGLGWKKGDFNSEVS